MARSAPAPLNQSDITALNARFADAAPQDLLAWALDRFRHKVAFLSSFGAEDVALIDMLWQLNPKARVITLDTLRLPTETYAVIDEIRARYGMDIELLYPDLAAVDTMIKERGYNCFYQSVENRKLCCGIRKVEPLQRALAGLDAWVSGLRRDQATTRAAVQKVEIDEVHGGRLKLNPLAEWSNEQVWAYIRERNVPFNALHEQGYPSIGCAPCTRAIEPGEDTRAGRWWWELDPSTKECGIHIGYDVSGAPVVQRLSEKLPR